MALSLGNNLLVPDFSQKRIRVASSYTIKAFLVKNASLGEVEYLDFGSTEWLNNEIHIPLSLRSISKTQDGPVSYRIGQLILNEKELRDFASSRPSIRRQRTLMR
ncbi:MAG: hypothetical protein ACR2PX_03160 [Endozoicomonas sp.]|uniref:hypothetical protein n=1 Tax=Endozoicomonas sp. TaxID=1892382 RepID=UPI003D9AFE61